MVGSRVLTWEVTESKGYETSWITSGARSLRARGRAVGTVPEPYWISYELDTADGFVTRRLCVSAETASGTHTLDLRHDGEGRWTADGEWLPELGGALDCDLGPCPLTNTLPVLRHRLHLTPGEREFLMARVSVPDLAVRASQQTYTHLESGGEGGRVRFSSGDHRSDLEFDPDGFVVDYPWTARRLAVDP
ncbi:MULTISPECIES: putative glycolipid-binding domain-containing protein [unclassified Streptomyces]|uniref:putative glycolipid-binding domain-containing protein n=1 Tax=unclassified Streptomyces TaxID=2593676 RepID=UPI0033AAC50B|nr:putative glycolipid-binding domain-containing protein [Streptomyces sp. NBC_01176]